MKRYGVWTAAALALTVIGAAPARAQEPSKVGLTMSSGSTVGVLIPVGAKAAIRPSLAFARSTTDYDGDMFIADEASSTTIVPGASVLFYLRSWENTRLYLSPQYSYARNTSSADDIETDPATSHTVNLMVGAQQQLGARFGVFAEAGLGWARHSASTPSSSTTSTSWGTRATVGGILFF